MDFDHALRITLEHEGGYANHPDDPGGATMRGITQAVYDAWRKAHKLETRPVKDILHAEVRMIYLQNYWVEAKCDKFEPVIGALHFDCAVNTGVRQANKILQRAAGVDDDGIIGPKTIAAAKKMVERDLAEEMLWKRLDFYRVIAQQKVPLRTFLPGWILRCRKLRDELLSHASKGRS